MLCISSKLSLPQILIFFLHHKIQQKFWISAKKNFLKIPPLWSLPFLNKRMQMHSLKIISKFSWCFLSGSDYSHVGCTVFLTFKKILHCNKFFQTKSQRLCRWKWLHELAIRHNKRICWDGLLALPLRWWPKRSVLSKQMRLLRYRHA